MSMIKISALLFCGLDHLVLIIWSRFSGHDFLVLILWPLVMVFWSWYFRLDLNTLKTKLLKNWQEQDQWTPFLCLSQDHCPSPETLPAQESGVICALLLVLISGLVANNYLTPPTWWYPLQDQTREQERIFVAAYQPQGSSYPSHVRSSPDLLHHESGGSSFVITNI